MPTVTQFPTAIEADVFALMTDPDNAKATDGVGATATWTPTDETPKAVRGVAFDFDSVLPAGATINSVKLNFVHRFDGGGGFDYVTRTYVDEGDGEGLQFRELHFSPSPIGGASYATEQVDLTADVPWTRAMLLNGNFKVAVQFSWAGADGTAELDSLSVEVAYNTAGPTPDFRSSFFMMF